MRVRACTENDSTWRPDLGTRLGQQARNGSGLLLGPIYRRARLLRSSTLAFLLSGPGGMFLGPGQIQ